jgi:hypothetical protein
MVLINEEVDRAPEVKKGTARYLFAGKKACLSSALKCGVSIVLQICIAAMLGLAHLHVASDECSCMQT